jgi:hypothetical protein
MSEMHWTQIDDCWISFDIAKESRQVLPPERKTVLVRLAPFRDGLPNMVMVGYLRYAAGDKNSPHFILPGVPEWAEAIGWLDIDIDARIKESGE